MTFALPYVITVSDGVTIRTIHPRALGAHRHAIEAALADLLDAPGVQGRHETSHPGKIPPSTSTATMTQGEIARAQGYTGDACMTCGQFMMKRNGACLSCDACGTTTGCS